MTVSQNEAQKFLLSGDEESLSKIPLEEVNKAKMTLFNKKILPALKEKCGINFVEQKTRTEKSSSGTDGEVHEEIEQLQYLWFGIKKDEWKNLDVCICFEFNNQGIKTHQFFTYLMGGISYLDCDRSHDAIIEFDDGEYDDFTIRAKYDAKTKKFVQIPLPKKTAPTPKSRYRQIRDFFESKRIEPVDETEYQYNLWPIKSYLSGLAMPYEDGGINAFFIFMLNQTDEFCEAINKAILRYEKIIDEAIKIFSDAEK